jgi:hypothetical protein
MNANQMTFGIEIETTIAVNTLVVGPHGRGYAIPQIPGWKAAITFNLSGDNRHVRFQTLKTDRENLVSSDR